MSREVESRVLELTLENSNFESNAAKSISTLEKLQTAIQFSGASEGLDEVGSAIKKISFSVIGKGAETAGNKINAFAIMAHRHLEKISDDLYNMEKRFIKSVTIDQVSAGWDKYAQKTEAVQTIMAATAKDIPDVEERMAKVNEQLEKLNWFTDETSYNFVDMVGNIGKFTSNNVSLEESVRSMEGISTWAAISGANVNEASHAMYNLSQAIATGEVKLMDWKSIENANMATASFKETAIKTAEALGTLSKASDTTWKTLDGNEVSIANFNEHLKDGWFTSEVLLSTLGKYGKFTDELYEFMGKLDAEVTTSDVLEYLDAFADGSIDWNEASKALKMSVGELKTELGGLSDESLKMGQEAFRAAQEAKTFQEAIDSVKDAASTGWMTTFEILFGDYTEAKVLWTNLANSLYDIFAEGGNVRNELLEKAFEKTAAINESDWAKLEEAGIANPEFIKRLRQSVAEHGIAVREMGSDEEWLAKVLERGALTFDDIKAAYESGFGATDIDEDLKTKVESLQETDASLGSLLETLGKYSGEDIEKIVFGDGSYTEGYEELERTLDQLLSKLGMGQEAGAALVEVLKSMGFFGGQTANKYHEMSDAQLRSLGLTQADIDEIHKEKEALEERNKVLDEMGEGHLTGGEMWTRSLGNAMEILVGVMEVVKETWSEIFPPATEDLFFNIAQGVYNATSKILDFVQNSEELRAVLRGVFSLFDILGRTVGFLANGAFVLLRFAFGWVVDLLIKFSVWLSNGITAVRNFIAENNAFGQAITFIAEKLKSAGKAVKDFADGLVKNFKLDKNLKRFKMAFKATFNGMPKLLSGIGERVGNFIDKLTQMDHFSFKNLFDIFGEFKSDMLDYISNFPGFIKIQRAFNALVNDIKSGLKSYGIDVDAIGEKAQKVIDIVGAIGGGAFNGLKLAGKQIMGLWESFSSSPLVLKNIERFKSAFGELSASLGPMFETLKERVRSYFTFFKEKGLNLDTIKQVFKDLETNVLGPFSKSHAFASVKDAFVGLWTDIKAVLKDNFGIDVDGIIQKLKNLLTSIEELFDNFTIPAPLQKFMDFLGLGSGGAKTSALGGSGVIGGAIAAAENFEIFGISISDVLQTLGKVFGTLNLDSLFKFLRVIILFRSIGTVIKNVGGIFENLGGFVKSIGDTITEVKDAIVNVTNAKAAEYKSRRLLELAAAVAILAIAVAVLARIPKDQLITAAAVVAGLGVALVVLSKIADKAGATDAVQKLGIGMAAFAASILLLVLALKAAEYIDKTQLVENLKLIGGMLVAIAAISIVVSKFAGSGSIGNGVGLLAMVASLFLFVGLIKTLEKIEFNDWDSTKSKLAVILIYFAGFMAAVRIAGKDALGAAAAIAAIGAAFVMLAIALKITASIKPDKLKPAAIAIAVLGVLLAVLIVISSKAEKGTMKAAALIMVVAVLASAIAALSTLDPKSLVAPTACIGALLALMSLLAYAVGKTSGLGLASIAVLALVVAGLAGILYLLRDLPVQQAIGIAGSLSILLLALSVAVSILGATGQLGLKNIAVGIAGLGLLMVLIGLIGAAIAGIAYLVGGMSDATIDRISKGLGRLFGGISNALGKLFGEGNGKGSGFKTSLSAAAAAGPGFGDAIEKIGDFLGKVFSVFGDAQNKTSLIDALPTLAEGLSSFFDNISPIIDKLSNISLGSMVALGAIFLGLLALLGIAELEGFVMGIIDWVSVYATGKTPMETISTDLGELGDALVDWDTKMEEIGEIDIPAGAIAGLAAIIGALEITGLVNAIIEKGAELLTGQKPIDTFTENLNKLGDALVNWQTKMDQIGQITFPAGEIAGMIAAIYSIDILGLVDAITKIASDLLTGKTSMENFEENLEGLATALGTWQSIMDGIGDITFDPDIPGLIASVEAIELTGFWEALNKAVSKFISGKTPMQSFEENVTGLATSLSSWQSIMSGIGDITFDPDIPGVISAVQSIDFQSLWDALEEEVVELISGETQMSNFQQKIEGLATALVTWQTKMDEIGNITVDETAISNLITAIESVPETGLFEAMAKAFLGVDSMDDFKENAKKLGEAMAEYSKAVSVEIDPDKVLKVTNAATKLGEMATSLASFSTLLTGTALSEFGSFIITFGGQLATFASTEIDADKVYTMSSASNLLATAATKLSEVKFTGDMVNSEIIDKVKANIETLSTMMEKLVDLDTSGVDKFTEAANKVASANLAGAATAIENKFSGSSSSMSASGSSAASSVVEGFNSKSSDMSAAGSNLIDSALSGISGNTDAFNAEGLNLITSLASGITAGAELVTAACTSIGSSALAVLRGYYDSWYGAGRYMAMGFGIGISSYIFEAAARARALANAALNSAKAALQERSPSKATYKMGEFFGMGFTNALTDYMSTAERTAYAFGTVAKDGLNRAIEESNRLLTSSDISNNPTIRPVLDLSEIQNGVGTIGDMLAVDAPIGVAGNFNAIGSNLNSRNTATSGDILSALNALGSTLGNRSGDTYNINGVTYDDGSNITDAVRSLIRAARVERRA